MSKPRVYRTEGIVLKAFDLGEADRLLTLFTPHSGKLRVVAKGVRRTKSRMSGHLDLFTRSNLLVASGRQLDIVTQADTIENFRALRSDLWRVSFSHYVAELVDAFGGEALANYPLYNLATTTMRRLATESDLAMVVRAFELQLLALTGYRPQLHRCLQCSETIKPQINHFSARMGGILCPSCRHADHSSPAISVSALKVMRNLQTDEEAMLRVAPLDGNVQGEVEHHLREYIVYRLESRPRSVAFLDRLRSDPAFADS